MTRRLVILGNTLTALAVCRDARRRGFEPILVDRAWGIAFHTRSASPVLLAPAASDEEACERICRLAECGQAYLIATGDGWVRFIVANRARLDAAFTRVLHASNETLSVCLNKARFARWCRDNSIPAPRPWFPGEEPRPEGMGFPLFIRPAVTIHDRPRGGIPKAAEISTENELAELLDRYAKAGLAPLVTESLLGEPLVQYSVAVARNGAESQSFVAIKARPAPEACAVGTYVELSPDAEIEASVLEALRKLNYYGIAEVEVLRSTRTGRHVLIEVNARPWLQYSLAPASGHDFLGLLIGDHQSDVPRKTGVAWLNWREDLYVCWSRRIGLVRKGRISFPDYVRSIANANVYAVYAIRDLAPFLARWPFSRGHKQRIAAH